MKTDNFTTNPWVTSIVTILIAAGLVVIVLLFGSPASGTAEVHSTYTEAYVYEINKLQSLLDSPSLSTIARASLQEKLQMAERMAAQQSAGAAKARTTKVAPLMPKAAMNYEGPQEFYEGIAEGSDGIIRPSLADVHNMWQGTWDDKQYQVFAGAFSPELGGGGVVIVLDLTSEDQNGSPVMIPAPPGTGPLQITAVEESQILLTTQSGETIIFNLLDRSFED
jgi:hypothetical protein